MAEESYLQWLAGATRTRWWCDSGEPGEIGLALGQGAVGITTNPPLCAAAVASRPPEWQERIAAILKAFPEPSIRAEALVRLVVTEGAHSLASIHRDSGGSLGQICAQVDPARAGDRDAMLAMGRSFAAWSPQVSVKLPVTQAGLAALEELAAEGIPVTGTVSFSTAQILAVAEAHARGRLRAEAAGLAAGPCNAVLMIGRIDDYLMEVAADTGAEPRPEDIRQAGLAIAKRCYGIFRERGYAARLCVAALRGTYHATELAGGDFVLSIHPKYQKPLLAAGVAKEERMERPIAPDTLARLSTMEEFRKAYEVDGLAPAQFIGFGVTQRTLSQFSETGWRLLEATR